MLKKSLALMLTVVLMSSVTACGKNGESADQGKEESPQEITMVLDWTPNTNHTGLYVAQEKGYFEEAGLSVKLIQPTEDGAALMTASGQAQFGIDFQDTMAPAIIGDKALPITAVAALLQHNTSGIVSLKETGIDRPSALAGHNYATWDNPIEQAMLRNIVEEDGGNFDEVELIPSTIYDCITALNSDVDSIWIFKAWDGIATQVKGLDTNFLSFAEINPVFDYYTPVLIANNDFLKDQPETTKKFLAAVQKGYEYAIENPEESAEILLKAAPELDQEIVMESQKWISGQYKAEVERWGYIEPARWDGFYNWLSENKLVEIAIPEGTAYSNDYLPE